MLGVLN